MARVLVVDAEESQRGALLAGLTLEGFEVAFVASCQDALEILGSPSSADVAMIDLMIPGLNGLDLARQIRGAFPNVRVVLSSAYHLSARQVERTHCGAVGFVPKPYAVRELCSYLRSKARTGCPVAC
jgi:DNA-binding NtrC family response regulator